MRELKIRTDFTRPEKMIRIKRREEKDGEVSLTQPSQVLEFVAQLILSRRYMIKGIHFVVRDPFRMIIEIQVQCYWWDRYFNRTNWTNRCNAMGKLVSLLMPTGYCKITLM